MAKLYLPPGQMYFGSREAHRLTYTSCQESHDRLLRKIAAEVGTERVAEDDLAYIPFTYPFNISGQPAISLPFGWTEGGLPIGVQLVGQPYGEASIIALAAQVERAAPWGAMYPAPLSDPSGSAGTAMGQG